MDMREWALVAFTILAQMAVGSFLVLGVVHFLAQRKAGEAEADRLSDRALLAIGPVLVLGMIASLLHLGTPLSAYRAVTNVGTSWLSREILFGVLFAAAGFLFAIMQWRKLGTPGLRTAIAAVAAIIGVALVYSMARVYMIDTQPSWNTNATPLSFFTTTLLLGALAMGAAFSVNYAFLKTRREQKLPVQSELLRDALRWIALASIVLLGIQLLIISADLVDRSAGDAAASVTKLSEEYGTLFVLRMALVFIGAGIFAFFLYKNAASAGKEEILATLVYGAFVLVLIGEVVGRYLFYATHTSIGL